MTMTAMVVIRATRDATFNTDSHFIRARTTHILSLRPNVDYHDFYLVV